MAGTEKLGLSGSVAKRFLDTEITPLLALLGLLMGLFAVLVTPREEEPQIDVTMANVFVPFPGATAAEVEQLVATPAEQVMSELPGVEHVYSVSRPGMAVLTVQFEVGERRGDAIVRLYNQVFSHGDWFPQNLGVGRPLVRPMGIDDVPIVALTLWTADETRGAHQLKQVAQALEAELKRVPGTRDIYTLGGPERAVRVLLDPQRMAGHGIAMSDLRNALAASNVASEAGSLVRDGREISVRAGEFLLAPRQVAELVVALRPSENGPGKPVYLADVADVRLGPDHPEQLVWHGEQGQRHPAVTIAIAKKTGSNAVRIADALIARVADLRGTLIPEGVEVAVTRNYGETANDKAQTLMLKLAFATAVVIALVAFALGLKEAFIVGFAVVVTLAITLFASWAWGFTLNRVSLFALIFSIGILVDDAIVVVENIHRHLALGARNLLEAIPRAVDEVGGPTILATFTVIAALLPMAFVSGLMGPYMSPIPINASMGMLISLAVAFVVTPWMSYKLLKNRAHHAEEEQREGRMHRFFARIMTPFLRGREGRWARLGLFFAMLLLIAGSVSLAAVQSVVLKMLPFDNKSEFQIVVDMPEGTALEETQRVLDALGDELATVPEVRDYQTYAGTAAPINFNGLVRQYYLRSGANVGDIQVNLLDKRQRERKSHDIALSVRGPLQRVGERFGANVKIVEVPPGPPVMAPLVVEIYGPEYAGQIALAQTVREQLAATADIIDIDDSVEAPAQKLILAVDRRKAALLGVSQRAVAASVAAALSGEDIGYLRDPQAKYALPVRMELPEWSKSRIERVLALKVRSQSGALVPLSEVVTVRDSTLERSIYHKDLLPVVFVTADMAGPLDSPLYGMFEVFFNIDELDETPQGISAQHLIDQPQNTWAYSIKWDGEWQITYETFRDMGLAYAVGMILIYLLVVAQFRSYLVPLIIMAPIPLTIIGVMPGHALLGAQFTATSMIGMIALAGIIVRNSILLVDFINQQLAEGVEFQAAVINAAAVRTQPIVLTALAAMLGAFFILDDPIFSGLAVSLIFGILVSTVLTLVVIPVLYYAALRRRYAA